MKFPLVARWRLEAAEARAEWAEKELRASAEAGLRSHLQLQGCEKAVTKLEKELEASEAERADLQGKFVEVSILLASKPRVETLGAVAAQTEPPTPPKPERERPRVLSPLEVVNRATEHRNQHRIAGGK